MENEDSLDGSTSSEEDPREEKAKYDNNSAGCCFTFSSEVLKLSVISYYFWTSFCYIAGSITFICGYTTSSLRIHEQIVCAASSNVYVFSSLWMLIGMISVATCICYAMALDGEGNQIHARKNSPLFLNILGILCKTVPTIVRVIHIFNLFQLYVMTLDVMILPECNSFVVRFVLFIVHIFWWTIVILGIVSRRKIFLPPHLYKPITNDVGYIVHVNNLLHSFGL
ncbi:conserved Plasmodium protein, unknown function [Plasmodium vivax]|uniref:Transmembrane protein n=6 Tax=Plasmodium vivax TaxID=5855 RepID=A5K704_PLAVS|nr:hypothetical protein, conserved [Plasmodium vivax]KMZ81118.1 hypothetical protein PVIIG_02600 [Plasmodium vivax India VII]KMZ87501.1 hypothetical protein PVBG_04210 [Plasmodium vivax Brazil I]KMZ93790.1 hypothetical protein PVMG_05043 [Plasmodium vivax Mauritania I]KNA00492.1 hypothetical protein PVNG_01126 [Plasmodium vivax North Korean]EDL45095.1 hypothetical protein, conserved [Plasmodium vivax]|eukprot:XP_001614822.1 hypothetical protein [Plasmodium vivax Sal-1]